MATALTLDPLERLNLLSEREQRVHNRELTTLVDCRYTMANQEVSPALIRSIII